MEFEELKAFSERVEQFKDVVQGEQNTKNVMIEPVIKMLGYDTHNPFDVITEYTCDFGVKKGEKVDYALMKDKEVVMLIEAKDIKTRLDQRHIGQLFRYYSVTNVRLAMLTNGIEYLFFMDATRQNTMDTEPFFRFNILDFTEEDYNMLMLFRKEVIDTNKIRYLAITSAFRQSFINYFIQQAKKPSHDFVTFITKNIGMSEINSVSLSKLVSDELINLLKTEVTVEAPDPSIFPKDEKGITEVEQKERLTGIVCLSEFTQDTIKGTRVKNLLIDDKRYGVSSWKDILISFIEYTFSLGKSADFVCSLDNVEDDDKGWVRRNSENMRTPREFEEHGIFVEVHGSAYTILNRVKSICSKLGLDLDNVLIELK